MNETYKNILKPLILPTCAAALVFAGTFFGVRSLLRSDFLDYSGPQLEQEYSAPKNAGLLALNEYIIEDTHPIRTLDLINRVSSNELARLEFNLRGSVSSTDR